MAITPKKNLHRALLNITNCSLNVFDISILNSQTRSSNACKIRTVFIPKISLNFSHVIQATMIEE